MATTRIAGAGPRTVRRSADVRIPLRDGCSLAADLYLPVDADARRVPAIIEFTPYHKRAIGDPLVDPISATLALRFTYFASHGYAVLVVDARGTGDSEGINDGPNSTIEGDDIVETIEWAATQDWSLGTVGMIGISYTAGSCYEAAKRAPEALKAIVALQMASNWDTGVLRPGGVIRPFVFESYGPLAAAYGFAPPDPRRFPSWRALWSERLEHTVPWCSTFVRRLGDTAFWNSRLIGGHERDVTAAVMLIAGWADWYPTEMLDTFSRLDVPKRIIVGPWTHDYPESAWPEPRIDDRYECLRWFDRYLKGIETDPARPVEREPAVTLFVREFDPPAPLHTRVSGAFATLPTWPPPAGGDRTLYLGSNGRLRGSPSPAGRRTLPFAIGAGVAAGRYVSGQFHPGWGMPDDQRLEEPFALVFTSSAMPRGGFTVVGSPAADLELQRGAEAAMVAVKLCDVHPDGTSVLITNGLCRLSPKANAAAPATTAMTRIKLRATAYHVRPGHRLRLLVSSMDLQNCLPHPGATDLTLLLGRSAVELPTTPMAEAPAFRPSSYPIPPIETVQAPSWQVSLSPLGRTAGVDFTARSGIGVNRSRYRISSSAFVRARIVASYDYPFDVPGVAVRVRSTCVTIADRTKLRHRTRVSALLNGERYWSREWVDSVDRPDVTE